MNWPTKGADLNPVENIWAPLPLGVSNLMRSLGQPKNPEDLWSYVHVISDQLLQDNYEKSLYESIPKRVSLVIKNKGNWTKY
jgi:hypothetical protein